MEKKSKKKYIIFSAAVVVIAAVIFVVWSVTSNSTLKKECPALEKGKIVTLDFFESIPGVEINTDRIELEVRQVPADRKINFMDLLYRFKDAK